MDELSEHFSQRCLELSRVEQRGKGRESELSYKEKELEQLRRENQVCTHAHVKSFYLETRLGQEYLKFHKCFITLDNNSFNWNTYTRMTLLQCHQCVIEYANPVPMQIKESLCIFTNKPVPFLYENLCIIKIDISYTVCHFENTS